MRRSALALAAITVIGLAAGVAQADAWKPLVTPQELGALIAAEEPILVDIRSVADYAAGHVEGAVNVPYHAWRGPETNPGALISDDKLTLILSELGVEADSRVVVTYRGADGTDFGAAARVYWTLKSAGLTEIAILNGGLGAWTAAGQPLSTEAETAEPSTATFALADTWRIDRDGIAAVVEGKREAITIDARPVAFFTGDKAHPAASRPGTLPGARSLPEAGWFAGGSPEIESAEAVLARVKQAGYPTDGKEELVSFCNTGHWAATNWFALSELAGIEDVKLYPESMVGWANSGGALVNGQTQ
jgi:thiosulfate/3-mercaptopyruvate sulfurtransferase